MRSSDAAWSLLLFSVLLILPACSADISAELPPQTIHRVARYEFLYALSGLLSGLAAIIGGIWVVFKGIQGKIEWIVKGLGVESKLAHATPGVLLVIVGLFIILFTRHKVKISRPREGDKHNK